MAEKNTKKSKANSPKAKDKKLNQVNGTKESASVKSHKKHIVFDDDGEFGKVNTDETHFSANNSKNTETELNKSKNKKIVFNEDGKPIKESKKSKKNKQQQNEAINIGKRWFELYNKYDDEEVAEIKNSEIDEIEKLCKTSFEKELPSFEKGNPGDAKWLKTALQKGTAKDRANAGAMLVQANPIANLSTLEILIGFSKNANKSNSESFDVTTDLFMNALLPAHRKLKAANQRGAEWKRLRKNESIDASEKSKIYAYWHFEDKLKEQYFEFLRNMQTVVQSAKEEEKGKAISCVYRLLIYAPEKEQLLLQILVNKLGDPLNTVASKALYYLRNLAIKHPAMCGVIAAETEKFLFRNNISEHAQHFGLCYLAELSIHGNIDVCVKLVNICFDFFKILVAKGSVNSKMMQAILRCLKNAIADVVKANKLTPGTDSGFLSKDTLNTVYRLVHHADLYISLQTLALLLQIVAAGDENSGRDRFYMALYAKMLDPNLPHASNKTISLFLHIIHQAIHIDGNAARSQALIKRLLQISLQFPANAICGCLIVIGKLLGARPSLNNFKNAPVNSVTVNGENIDDKKKDKTDFDIHARNPAYSGAEYSHRNELLMLARHHHPTVQLFAQSLIDKKPINFYGDPLVDFSISYFLERFVFKNPKKTDSSKPMHILQKNRFYKAFGSRGQSVHQLTDTNCTEDERFIFDFLNKKRERKTNLSIKNDSKEIDDDEFDAYLDSLGPKDKKSDADDSEDEECDFLADYKESASSKKKKSRKNDDLDDEENDLDDDGLDDAEDGSDDENLDDDSDGSISLDEEDNDGSDIFEDESEEEDMEIDSENEHDISDPDEPSSGKIKPLSGKDFQRKLKNTDNIESLFAAAEDFSEMLEETGKDKKHGTLGEIFNRDKSSQKQLEWEEKRSQKRGGQRRFRAKPQKPIQKKKISQGMRKRGHISKKSKPSFKK